MSWLRALRRLWRYAPFRRLLILRLFAQAADGTLQVGMASYVLFSPQSQPDAWAIAAVLAVSLLPFTLVGPFVSPLLDVWSRRDVALYTDVARAVLSLLMAGVVLADWTTGLGHGVLLVSLLVALSLNRFMLAGLSAGMHHTVSEREFLAASAIIPAMGPLGVVLGGVIGVGIRLGLAGLLGARQADAVIFTAAAGLFVAAAVVAGSFAREALGPERPRDVGSAGVIWSGLRQAAVHLRQRPAAVLALGNMAVTRHLFGLLSVAMILVARNRWHSVAEADAALADLSVWGACAGAGFMLAALVVPSLVAQVGLRWSLLGLLAVGAFAMALASFSDLFVLLCLVGFLMGLVTQAVKICADAVVHAHVDEGFKGRVFTFYDVGFNGAYVLAAVAAAFLLPADGVSAPAFAAMSLTCCGLVVLSSWGIAQVSVEDFERGTEDIA